jgi:hypothetical protein
VEGLDSLKSNVFTGEQSRSSPLTNRQTLNGEGQECKIGHDTGRALVEGEDK